MFRFESLPSELPLSLSTKPVAQRGLPNRSTISLGTVFLRADWDRLLWKKTLEGDAPQKKSLRVRSPMQQVEGWLKDCRRDHYHLLVMQDGGSDKAGRAVEQVLSGYDEFDEIKRFLNCPIAAPEELSAKDLAELSEREWGVTAPGEFFAAALDADGKELGRFRMDTQDEDFAEDFKAFIIKHAPPKIDAEVQWQAAFDEARRTSRRVWALSGGRYCGPCFMLSRWQDKHREIIEREFVLLKVNAAGHINGSEVAKRITLGEYGGIPFHAIFDSDGNRLIDSIGPLGNIGMPSSFEGTEHLADMLQASPVQMTDEEIQSLVESLRE